MEYRADDRSRILRCTPADKAKIEREPAIAPAFSAAEAVPLRRMHATGTEFELLDKAIVFAGAQVAARRVPAPVVLVVSAGSCKTAVTAKHGAASCGGPAR